MLSVRPIGALTALFLVLSLSVCGGGGSAPGGNQSSPSPAIAFMSDGALNGTDASNTGCGPKLDIPVRNIWGIQLDGSGYLPLTKMAVCVASSETPVWSPDGTRIAFSSARALDGSATPTSGIAFNVWVMKADGSGAIPLTKLTTASAFALAWSPDGSKLTFLSTAALDGTDVLLPTANLWVMNADGSAPVPLTRLTACQFCMAIDPFDLDPVWSPSGTRLIFDSSRALDGSDAQNANGSRNIWIVNADGSGLMPLTKYTSLNVRASNASWSPDGSEVAFLSSGALDGSDTLNLSEDQNVWVMAPDGTGAKPLTKYTGNFMSIFDPPRWSPDGTKIAFASDAALDGSNTANANVTENVWVMKPDGTGATPLTAQTAGGAGSFNLAWSPDGTKIAFVSNRSLDGSQGTGGFNIWVINNNGSGATPLTRFHFLSPATPSWRP